MLVQQRCLVWDVSTDLSGLGGSGFGLFGVFLVFGGVGQDLPWAIRWEDLK